MATFRRVIAAPRQLIAPIPVLADPRVRLFLTSSAVLFVELFLIRWIPSNVVYFGFFTNLILIASFLGMGLGIILGRRNVGPRLAPFPILFFIVIGVISAAQLNVTVAASNDVLLGGSVASGVEANIAMLIGVFALVVAAMAALALPLGWLLRSMPPLRAYAIDITGSLAGIAAFTAMSFAGVGPAGWTVVVALLITLLALGRGVTAWSFVSAAAIVACLLLTSTTTDLWSPYQRLTLKQLPTEMLVAANGVPHQGFPTTKHPLNGFYPQVGEWYPGHKFDDVLIIGAGTGNDVAMAELRGDGSIDAVEIDPTIHRVGEDLNAYRPYQDPRVTTSIDDGRAFLNKTDKRYDLVVLALTDSLTLFSSTGNVRLESFLYTREAFQAVRDHLKPDGMFVLYNFYREEWLVDRLGSMLVETFGRPTMVSRFDDGWEIGAVLANGPGLSGALGVPAGVELMSARPSGTVPTDDWPFLYMFEPGIATPFLVVLVLVLSLAAAAVLTASRWAGLSVRRFSPHFFLLGAAFLLLETRALVSFGLLFGNTWVVNALVFFAILLSVLASIGVASRLPRRSPAIWYAALFASLLITWFVPPSSLLVDPPIARYALAAALTFAPVFFANLCFTYSFRDSPSADMSFASNLLGAVVGGAIEYVALITGYQALAVIVAVLYLAAYGAVRWLPMLADRELVRHDVTDRDLPDVPVVPSAG